ncbi:MAG: hypothetical protein ACHQZR_00470 [Candidatus Limnocylindrales bacterium]
MTSVAPPMCKGCTHLTRDSDRPLADPKCAAFPAGIPTEILLSRADHRTPYPGDRGMQFAPQTDQDARYAAMIFGDEEGTDVARVSSAVASRAELAAAAPAELLGLYGAIMDELLARGIARTSNNPVADYAEYLAARAFKLQLVPNSVRGYDAVDETGLRYEVKARRLQARNRGRQLSFFRGFDLAEPTFDVLIAVLFAPDLSVRRAALMPFEIVRAHAARSEHVNGWRMTLADAIWSIPGVNDVTEQIRSAAEVPAT